MSDIRLGIIGAGNIAQEHLKVIAAMSDVKAFGIISRTPSKAEDLANSFQIDHVYDSVADLVKSAPDGIMVLVSANQIYDVTMSLIPEGIPLFIEKPPGLYPEQTSTLVKLADQYCTKTMVGFNRRYYSIFRTGLELINDRGGLLGLQVEGHERFWKIAGGGIPDEIRKNWIYANSTHTIDLLRFFGGKIKSMQVHVKSLKEKKGDQFLAALEFDSGALGSYSAQWWSPGGWSATLYGDGISVQFKPLETGFFLDTDFNRTEIELDSVDSRFKPGFYHQLNGFINLVKTGTLESPGMDLKEALKTMELAQKFACD